MKIQECKAIDESVLLILSDDGRQGFFDVSSYFDLDAFLPLKNVEEFKSISNGGYFIEWASGADLSADTIEAKWFGVTDKTKKLFEIPVHNIIDSVTNKLREGSEVMSIQLTLEQESRLITYISEFEKWNKAYNLSAVRDPKEMVSRHLLDSLSVVPWLEQHPELDVIIDVGTGGGLPGIPLSIMFPERRWTLLDSNGKKMRFLFHIKTLLKLDNVTIENRRVETFQPEQKFDAVISRAFASLQDMTEGCSHLLKTKGLFLAMKGLFPQDEIEPIKNKIDLIDTVRLIVAATEGERHLLVLQPR